MTRRIILASWRRGMSTLGVLAAFSVTAAMQAPPEFAVASIRTNVSGAPKKAAVVGAQIDGGGVIEPPRGGCVIATGANARMLLRYAYGEVGSDGQIVRPLEAARIVGSPTLPAWVDEVMFDIDARMDSPSRGPMERTAMMRRLLEERFAIRAHRETRDLPVFNLVFARADRRLGPALHELNAPCVPAADRRTSQDTPCAVRTGPGSITGHGVAIAAVATYLSPIVGRVVIDRTGLSGRFDMALRFALAPDAGVQEAKAALLADAPSIFTAAQEQLGLRLESDTGPVDVVVVDRIEMPTEN